MLAFSLLWEHTRKHETSLKRLYRRPGFPSWSWAGWSGGASFRTIKDNVLESCLSNVHFQFETGSSKDHTLLSATKLHDYLEFRFPRSIHLDARIVSPKSVMCVVDSDFWKVDGRVAEFHLSEPREDADICQLFIKGEWKLILMAKSLNRWTVYYMVVEQQRGFATRVGTLRFPTSSSSNYIYFHSQHELERVCLPREL